MNKKRKKNFRLARQWNECKLVLSPSPSHTPATSIQVTQIFVVMDYDKTNEEWYEGKLWNLITKWKNLTNENYENHYVEKNAKKKLFEKWKSWHKNQEKWKIIN
jgi:hypothetical protein